jgi:NADH dehydrogenase [ubiquinone] 1 alpha subcomplex assembly factor 7
MTPLEAEIRRIIATDGPIPIDRYMELCLSHPRHGYYITRDPLGAAGDFVTTPEVSQMFGELLGAWAATVWRQMESPPHIRLIELGPGRGTLMADALRAAKALPAFHAALTVHMVEVSPVLRTLQQARLANAGVPVVWHHTIEEVPEGPTIAIANEFVDALPISQFIKDHDGWHVRMVGVVDDKLAFVAAPDAMLRQSEADTVPRGAILERRYDRPVSLLARRIAQHGGAALIIDYGHAESAFGDTLQAVRGHRFADPLETPGQADLTAQVDFAAVAMWVQRQDAVTRGPIPQGEFLRRLGIEERAARLKANATPQQAADIDAALTRLTAADQMGELFKVLAMADPKLGPLPGFDR